jgi:hypothetical protein
VVPVGFGGKLRAPGKQGFAPLVSAAVTVAVIAIARVALKPRATSGPAGEQDLPVQQAEK